MNRRGERSPCCMRVFEIVFERSETIATRSIQQRDSISSRLFIPRLQTHTAAFRSLYHCLWLLTRHIIRRCGISVYIVTSVSRQRVPEIAIIWWLFLAIFCFPGAVTTRPHLLIYIVFLLYSISSVLPSHPLPSNYGDLPSIVAESI